MNNPFDYTPDPRCLEAYADLLRCMERWRRDDDHASFFADIDKGKMLGVLVAEDAGGAIITLNAFSGQAGGRFDWPGFVGPVFDYLDEKGYFKTEERKISALNAEIYVIERDEIPVLRSSRDALMREHEAALTELRAAYSAAKQERDIRRAQGIVMPDEEAAMLRESQFQKAEIHRLKVRQREEIRPLVAATELAESRLLELKRRRQRMSEGLQRWLFDSFELLNAEGEKKSLTDIFGLRYRRGMLPSPVPPSGAGECCAPKLLQAAYRRGLRPLSIAEFWYGPSPGGEVRHHGAHYPACNGKCRPILEWMLRGLDVDKEEKPAAQSEIKVIYEDARFCVVEKPAGILSVPGRSGEPSVADLLRKRYGHGCELLPAHRLDRDTSGLLVVAFDMPAFTEIQREFAGRRVIKRYEALLDGVVSGRKRPWAGVISLPLSPDINDRPRQLVDMENGKEAVTRYEVIEEKDGMTRISFYPLTGRTHQLRVHSASVLGLGIPIIGDPLYGDKARATRMCLHAAHIEFHFPAGGCLYSFDSVPGF